jgi:hypothetical protein
LGPKATTTFSTFEAGESGATGIADALPAAARPKSAVNPTIANLSFMVSSCGIPIFTQSRRFNVNPG